MSLANSNPVLYSLLVSDPNSKKARVYQASFKFHVRLEFKKDLVTGKLFCEGEIDTRVFVKKRDQWDNVWVAIRDADFDIHAYQGFEKLFSRSIENYVYQKLFQLGFIYEKK